jgi:hypothetical protein
MAISDKLVYLNETKTAIKNAIEAKGVTVGEATFREYATKVSEIESGGGESDIFMDLLQGNIDQLDDEGCLQILQGNYIYIEE